MTLNFGAKIGRRLKKGAPYMCANLSIAKLKISSTSKLVDKFVHEEKHAKVA